MERNSKYDLIKRLQTELPHGAPFDLAALRRLGVSPQAAARYASTGWLERLGVGVYARPGDSLTQEGAVKLLQEQVKGLHVGGKSALALHGVRHNLPSQETLTLWGDVRFTLPQWFVSHFPARYVHAKLFDWPDAKLPALTVTTPPGVANDLHVSSPERAALEMLYEVGTHESLAEVENIFQGLRNVRKDLTGQLLSCCNSVKAVRLFLACSAKNALLDVEALRQRFDLKVGSEHRWVSRLKDGQLLSLKPYG